MAGLTVQPHQAIIYYNVCVLRHQLLCTVEYYTISYYVVQKVEKESLTRFLRHQQTLKER